jgi:CheY-like chemotaxis protein
LARKILLADDSVTAQNMGRKILSDAGYEVITVNNGSAALKKIAEQKPDLIVLDVYMPGYSGLEVCQRLKETRETERIPVMLTVGKLEPFKPEEAKRVRAEGFIVKPFEASELLSALSKLEDKIVPRSEASKTGRFGRALAAIEEADQASDEDKSGWKKRIAFPSKKKREENREVEDVSGVYGDGNPDLRTVTELHSADTAKPQHSQKGSATVVGQESWTDVGAIAPPGLPKDVTAEEIAAIAAAAAQVQAVLATAKDAPREDQSQYEKSPEAGAAAGSGGYDPQPTPQASTTGQECKSVSQPGEESGRVTAESTASVPVATFATAAEGHRSEKGAEQAAVAPDADSKAEAPATELIATAPVASDNVPALADSGNNAEHWSQATAETPLSMAAAAGAASSSDGRWTAVAVAVNAEEEAISLELEMEKAHAAHAAAEANYPGFVSSIPNTSFSESTSSIQSLPTVESEATPTANAVAPVAAETLEASAALRENDATSQVSCDSAAQPIDTPAQTGTDSSQSEPQDGKHREPSRLAVEAFEERVSVPVPPEEKREREDEKTVRTESIATSAPVVSDSQTVYEPQTVAESAPAAELSAAPTASARTAESQESDWADSTASAGSSSGHSEDSREPAQPAAMAVAAGAEKSPEDVSASTESDSGEIASIVDSVLADLRPKIVAEISKKLGKKK